MTAITAKIKEMEIVIEIPDDQLERIMQAKERSRRIIDKEFDEKVKEAEIEIARIRSEVITKRNMQNKTNQIPEDETAEQAINRIQREIDEAKEKFNNK